jgi:hypothetical protein
LTGRLEEDAGAETENPTAGLTTFANALSYAQTFAAAPLPLNRKECRLVGNNGDAVLLAIPEDCHRRDRYAWQNEIAYDLERFPPIRGKCVPIATHPGFTGNSTA